jgi:ferrochelatase
MSHSQGDTAILVMAFGGPADPEEAEEFLRRCLGGKLPSRERIEEAKRRYRLIGGGSPLTKITLRQAGCLKEELVRRGYQLNVLTGLRFSKPFVEDAVAQMKAGRIRQVIALPMTLHRSKLSTGPYFATLEEAMKNQKVEFDLIGITGWHIHPLFIEALEEKVIEGLSRFAPEARKRVEVIFSAHSLPDKAVSDDPYVREIHETIKGLLDRMGPMSWHLAFQSRGGGSLAWLEPDVEDVLNDLSRKGCREVLVVPVGFVSDHLETLYDLDIKYREQAKELGMEYERSPSLNDSPKFIQALAQVVIGHLETFEAKSD